MAVTYKKLFHLMIDRGISNAELMEKAGVIGVPGSSFGSLGEGFMRFALVEPVPVMEEIVKAIDESGLLREKGE